VITKNQSVIKKKLYDVNVITLISRKMCDKLKYNIPSGKNLSNPEVKKNS
jgi:hypothetical protein